MLEFYFCRFISQTFICRPRVILIKIFVNLTFNTSHVLVSNKFNRFAHTLYSINLLLYAPKKSSSNVLKRLFCIYLTHRTNGETE